MSGAVSDDIRVSAVAFLRDAPEVPGGVEVLTVRKHGTRLYQFPGGKPDPGEHARDAAVREVAEETGVHVVGSSLGFAGTFTAPAANEAGHTVTADLFLHVGDMAGEPVAAAEIADARWLPVGTPHRTPDDPEYPLAPLMHATFPRLADAGPAASYRKHNPGRPGDWEQAGLDWLDAAAAAGGVPVAGVRARMPAESGRGRGDLLLRRVTPVAPDVRAAEDFGRRLAVTHRCGAPAFGSGPDGWQGSGYQGPNDSLLDLPLAPTPSWGDYYAAVVIAPLARRVRDGVPGGIPGTDRLLERLTAGDFDDGRPPARLHGDLWSGNLMWAADGAVLIDPSAHGGHGLTDLGFLTMFGAPHLDRILDAYAEAAQLQDGWRELLPLHRLHVLYLHAAVFGGGYVDETAATVRQVLGL
ncbi:fructosamine kinase family protein [Corynebacterium sp.]|uniref:fructosamine kinase family protein n=1 Tax=Corynebacterium sp. TaxID=1720 RepID=UPI003B3A65D4